MGRERVYTSSISMPKTCRSTWRAVQQTTGCVMAGHQESLTTDSFTTSD
jgi:hypothetical protein